MIQIDELEKITTTEVTVTDDDRREIILSMLDRMTDVEMQYRTALSVHRFVSEGPLSAHNRTDWETAGQHSEMVIERQWGLADDHLTYRKWRCEDCGTVETFPDSPGFCGDCNTWEANWREIGDDERDGDDEGEDDG